MNNSSVSINSETVDKPDKYKPGKLLFGYEFNAKKNREIYRLKIP